MNLEPESVNDTDEVINLLGIVGEFATDGRGDGDGLGDGITKSCGCESLAGEAREGFVGIVEGGVLLLEHGCLVLEFGGEEREVLVEVLDGGGQLTVGS